MVQKAWLLSSPKTTLVILNNDDFKRITQAVCQIDNCDADDITITELEPIELHFKSSVKLK